MRWLKATDANRRVNTHAEDAQNALENRIKRRKYVSATRNLVDWPIAGNDETLYSGAFQGDGSEALLELCDVVN